MAKRPTMLQRAANWLATKAYVGPTDTLGMGDGSWTPLIREPFSGAWQRNIGLDTRGITAFSAVYACISIRARDISKLRPKLMRQDEASGVWQEVRRDSPFLQVLRKPNRYQTRIQFYQYWMVSKLIYGNAYALKVRDARGIVTDEYPLDPRRVTARVGKDGSVWYDCAIDFLSGIKMQDTLPASEIIHDRCMPLWHPLVGVSPLYAAAMSAGQGVKIQEQSALFFENRSAPSGHLSAPGAISDATAKRMKSDAEAAIGGVNYGRLLVTGDGIKYEPFTMPATDAQLIEQLGWTVQDVARAFGVPLHKIMAGALPQVGNMAALDQNYYQQTLQEDIESIELLQDEGLGLVDVDGKTYGMEFDLEGLLRMDPMARAERLAKLGGVLKPDEMRASENYMPVKEGGDDVYLQQQNYSLSALHKRDAKPDPFETAPKPVAAPTPEPAANDADVAAAAAKAVEPIAQVVTQTAEQLTNLKTEMATDREETAKDRTAVAEFMRKLGEGIESLKREPEDDADEQAAAVHGFATKTLEGFERAFAD